MARFLSRGFIDRLLNTGVDTSTMTVRASLYTGPVTPMPASAMRVEGEQEVHPLFDVESHRVESAAPHFYLPATEDDLDPDGLLDRSWSDAAFTGVGDPFAGLIRSIDEALGEDHE